MSDSKSTTAIASIRWVGEKEFRPPWLRYNPQICVDNIVELDMRSATWDIVVRSINSSDTGNRQFNITFQFASPRAPHHLLTSELDFGLFEGPGVCVWQGTVEKTIIAPRDPSYWYTDDEK